MPRFMLILHNTRKAEFRSLSPAEMQRIIEDYRGWARKVAESGHMVGGEKLAEEGGKHVRRVSGGVAVVDGPYSETKEVVGGYFTIQAGDYAEAVAIAEVCPHLEWGWVEVRQVDAISGEEGCALGNLQAEMQKNRQHAHV